MLRQEPAPAYREAIVFALFQQVPMLFLSLLILDGGGLARVCGIAVAGCWAATLITYVRRPNRPTRVDLAMIRWSFFPTLFVDSAVAWVLASRAP